MASAVDSRLAYARLSAVAMASRLPTANRGSTNSYTTSWDTTAIQWQPFQLNPDMASEGADRGEYIRAKFGPGGYGQMAEALVEIGHSVGIDFDFDRPGRVPNTIDSHRLMGLAGSAGLQEELSEVMFRQYFGEGLDIGDAAILAAAGAEAGLDLAAMKALLETDEGRQEIKQSDAAARGLGISGVPTFVFDEKFAIVGAQEPAVFVELLDHFEAEAA